MDTGFFIIAFLIVHETIELKIDFGFLGISSAQLQEIYYKECGYFKDLKLTKYKNSLVPLGRYVTVAYKGLCQTSTMKPFCSYS